VSKSSFHPGSGIDAANQLCAQEKPNGVGQVKAALGTSVQPWPTLFAPEQSYVRVDGAFVSTGRDLSIRDQLATGIWQNGDGTYLVAQDPLTQFWAGDCPRCCNNWLSSDPKDTGGTEWIGYRALNNSAASCDQSLPILCFEP
jgi:hypothetical protein